jgi:hypothetical protein
MDRFCRIQNVRDDGSVTVQELNLRPILCHCCAYFMCARFLLEFARFTSEHSTKPPVVKPVSSFLAVIVKRLSIFQLSNLGTGILRNWTPSSLKVSSSFSVVIPLIFRPSSSP